MRILTISDLRALHRRQEQLNSSPNAAAQHFQMVMKQKLMGLPTEPLLTAYPQIKNWVLEVQRLLPKLFLLNPNKLLLETHFQAPLCLKAETVYIQTSTNVILRTKKPLILIDWVVRNTRLNWYDRVKLWTASEQLLKTGYKKPKLVILAIASESSATLIQLKWNHEQHEDTKTQLISLLEKSKPNCEPANFLEFKETNALDIQLDLEEIEEMKI